MKWWLGGLVLVAGLASAFNVVSLRLEHLMDPRWGARDIQLYIALIVIGVVTVIGLVLAFKLAAPKASIFAAAAVIVAAGFVPRAIYVYDQSQTNSAHAVANHAYEAKLLADLEARKQDVEAHIAARRLYTGEEVEEFIELVRHSNLTYMSLPDGSAAGMALMERALQGKVFDPNVPVKNRFNAGAPPLPLFVAFHRMIRQAPERLVETREWKLLLLMTGNGADLSVPVADAVAADLRKTATPLFDGLYLELK
jgi:hypothetical protein